MKSSSQVWGSRLLAMALVLAAAIPVAGQQPAPGAATPEQLARQSELMQRQVLAESLVAKDEAALGRTYDRDVRNKILKGLVSKSINELNAIPVGGAATAAEAPGLGDSADNLVYTPVPPCRIIDTRLAGGLIPAGGTRSFRATGAGFAGQGGIAGSCGVPF